MAVISEEGVDGTLLDETPAERRGVEHLPLSIGFPLHATSLVARQANREHPQQGDLSNSALVPTVIEKPALTVTGTAR
jgi:hypothetical protein